MIDQQAKFTAKDLSTEFVGEAQKSREVVAKVPNGDVQLVFISPENLISNKSYRNMLLSEKYLVGLIVDEAHCVKTWLLNYYNFLIIHMNFTGETTFVYHSLRLENCETCCR